MSKYYVIGGEYTDTTFTAPAKPLEEHGPYNTIDEARNVWKEKSMANIDNALIRYLVVGEDDSARPKK